MMVAPSSGSMPKETQQIFTLTYPDLPGFAGEAFEWVEFLVATTADGAAPPFCFVHYECRGNRLWMYSSDGGFFLGPVKPGLESTALNSSACSVNTAGTTVANTNGNLVLTVPIMMKAPMVGVKSTFQRIRGVRDRDTGFVKTGTLTIH